MVPLTTVKDFFFAKFNFKLFKCIENFTMRHSVVGLILQCPHIGYDTSSDNDFIFISLTHLIIKQAFESMHNLALYNSW